MYNALKDEARLEQMSKMGSASGENVQIHARVLHSQTIFGRCNSFLGPSLNQFSEAEFSVLQCPSIWEKLLFKFTSLFE